MNNFAGNHYVNNVIANIKKKLMDNGRELNAKQQSPFLTGYRPESNKSPEFYEENTNYFQEHFQEQPQ